MAIKLEGGGSLMEELFFSFYGFRLADFFQKYIDNMKHFLGHIRFTYFAGYLRNDKADSFGDELAFLPGHGLTGLITSPNLDLKTNSEFFYKKS